MSNTRETAAPEGDFKHTWTLKDINENTIDTEEVALQERRALVASLKEQIASATAALERAEEEVSSLESSLQWRRLMRDVQRSAEVRRVESAMKEAIKVFRSTLTAPEDYDEDSEGIPYDDTDDYGDLSEVENAVDDALETAMDVILSSSNVTSAVRNERAAVIQARRPESKRNSNSDGATVSGEGNDQGAGSRPGGSSKKESKDSTSAPDLPRSRVGLLMLLVVSLHVGKLLAKCRIMQKEGHDNVPIRDAEMLVETVTNSWNEVLNESPLLSRAVRDEWVSVVSTYLGEPFDSVS